MSLYRGMDRAALDAAYDNTRAVADSARILADWDRRSAELRAARPERLDLRYGPLERNRVDYFAASAPGPVLVFVHGGYWQMRAKETFACLAAGPLAHGMHVAFVAYTLAPGKPLSGIVAEVRDAVGWIAARVADWGGDPARVIVSGWSAGGHLTAMVLDQPGVHAGLAISGIYDLEPVRLCYLNEKLGLDAAEAARLSPLRNLPVRSKSAPRPLALAYGTAELPELQRQSRDYAAARKEAGLPVTITPLAGCNHFTILEHLARADGELTRLALELAQRA